MDRVGGVPGLCKEMPTAKSQVLGKLVPHIQSHALLQGEEIVSHHGTQIGTHSM